MALTVQDLATKLDDFAGEAKVKIKRYIISEGSPIIRDVVDIKKDASGNMILITELVSIQHDDHEETQISHNRYMGESEESEE
jgi:hypothetical protein